MTETLLTLSGIGFPPYSARGCQQTLELIQQPALHRTVNGQLIAVANPLFQKYRTIIEGADKHPPALDTLAIGHPVTAGCIQRLWQEVSASTAAAPTPIRLGRPSVESSIVVINDARQPIAFTQSDPQTITLTAPSMGKSYVGYCPILKTSLVDFHLAIDEWKHTSSWKLILEEV
jgi:hypothetical protein